MIDHPQTPAQAPTESADAQQEQTELAAAQETGHPGVDAVLASLEGLEERPVGEHVAVFEHGHDALRRALNDDAGGA